MVLRLIILKIVVWAIVTHASLNAQNGPIVQDTLLSNSLTKGIAYLELSQIRSGLVSNNFIGEWPTFIYNTNFIPFLGKKGKSAYDSNVFNTLFIHNTLAELYLTHVRDPRILNMLGLAQKNLLHYRNANSFNFWPELARPLHLKCKHYNCRQRRAVNFDYHYAFINNYANIYDDADDTSAGLLAYFYSKKLRSVTGDTTLEIYDSDLLLKNFAAYRDTGKRKTNWYNKRLGFNYRTGAFLTWFGPDRTPSHFFTWFFPSHQKQNILYGRNEIDCVVNANVLRSLFITGDTLIPGIKESKKYLRDVITKKVCFTCGVYYPTEFTFHYAMAKAIDSGVKGFDDLKKDLIAEIITKINAGGYWESQIENNDIQATLYALNALMLLDENNAYQKEISRGIIYLLNNRVTGKEFTHWKAGVFFSGGSAIRYEHVWRSEAYTTTLAIEAIANYLKKKRNT